MGAGGGLHRDQPARARPDCSEAGEEGAEGRMSRAKKEGGHGRSWGGETAAQMHHLEKFDIEREEGSS